MKADFVQQLQEETEILETKLRNRKTITSKSSIKYFFEEIQNTKLSQ